MRFSSLYILFSSFFPSRFSLNRLNRSSLPISNHPTPKNSNCTFTNFSTALQMWDSLYSLMLRLPLLSYLIKRALKFPNDRNDNWERKDTPCAVLSTLSPGPWVSPLLIPSLQKEWWSNVPVAPRNYDIKSDFT